MTISAYRWKWLPSTKISLESKRLKNCTWPKLLLFWGENVLKKKHHKNSQNSKNTNNSSFFVTRHLVFFFQSGIFGEAKTKSGVFPCSNLPHLPQFGWNRSPPPEHFLKEKISREFASFPRMILEGCFEKYRLKHWKLPLKLKKNDIIKKGEELQPNRFFLFQSFFASKVLGMIFVTHPFFFHNMSQKMTSFSSPGGCPSTHLGADPPYKASQPDTYCPDIWPGWDGCWGWGARQKLREEKSDIPLLNLRFSSTKM